MSKILLQGGVVVDQSGTRSLDVVIDQDSGLVAEVRPRQEAGPGEDVPDGDEGRTKAREREEHQPKSGRVLTIDGCILAPGFVDLHAHLGQPGNEAAETVESGSRAASLGGYTAIVAMPDTEPCVDNAGAVVALLALAERALCEVIPAGAVSVGRNGQTMAPMAELAEQGVSIFCDGGSGIQDAGFLQRALDYVGDLRTRSGQPCLIAQPCDLLQLSEGGQMNEGEWSVRLGLAGRPVQAEELMVAQALCLAKMTGTRVHLQHLSTGTSFGLVRSAKAEGLAVTADVSPHHLVLTDGACAGYDPAFKVAPPLRSSDDVLAAWAALKDGTIDAIATGHRPHTPDLKERPFDQAPVGALGLETALAVLLTDPALPLETLLACLSWKPAAIAGIGNQHGCRIEVGQPANLVVIDPDRHWTVKGKDLASRASNTPFEGRKLTGKVRHTIWNGELVVQDGKARR